LEKRGACRLLMGESEGKRPLERYMFRWDDNIAMDFEVGWVHRLYLSGSG
jgi:hypothetical protein